MIYLQSFLCCELKFLIILMCFFLIIYLYVVYKYIDKLFLYKKKHNANKILSNHWNSISQIGENFDGGKEDWGRGKFRNALGK